MSDRRRLIVMRHAKAEPFAPSDHARTLTDKGLASARDAGAHLGDTGGTPDYAVVSSAVRTRQTWDALVEAAGITDCEVSFDDAVFTGSAEVALEVLQAQDALTRAEVNLVDAILDYNRAQVELRSRIGDPVGAPMPGAPSAVASPR